MKPKTIHFSPKHYELIAKRAKEEGVSFAEIVRRMVAYCLKQGL